MTSTTSIQFKVVSFQPGSKGYNNWIFEPVTDFVVAVDVPLKYIVNAEKILTEPMAGNKAPSPILTIEGWAYIENVFLNRAIVEAEKGQSDDEIEWEGEENK